MNDPAEQSNPFQAPESAAQQPQLAQVSLLNGGGQARQQQPLAQVNIGNRQPLAQVSLGGQQQQQPLAQVNVGGSGGGGGIDLDLNPSMKDFVGFSYSRASRNPPSPRFIQFLNKVRLNRSQSSLFSMQNLLLFLRKLKLEEEEETSTDLY